MMRMYNPDGTPDVCGTAALCGAVCGRTRPRFRGCCCYGNAGGHLSGAACVAMQRMGRSLPVTVGMGVPRFDPPAFRCGFRGTHLDYPSRTGVGQTVLPITALSTRSRPTPSPLWTALPDDTRFFALSPQVERHPAFPERTSLMWCHVESPDRIKMRIWERGAGETWLRHRGLRGSRSGDPAWLRGAGPDRRH